MPAEVLPFGLLGRPHGTTGEIGLRPFHSGGWHLDVGPLPLAVTIWVLQAALGLLDGVFGWFLNRVLNIPLADQAAGPARQVIH